MRVSGIPYIQGRNSYSDADGQKCGIAIHNTSNDASDEAEASYAQRRTDGTSSHFYADGDSVIQSLDTAVKAGHAGSRQGNENAVAVEIAGANGWSREKWLSSVAWPKLGAVLAQVCRHYDIAVRRASVSEMRANPKVKAFYSHDDMRQAWGGTDHTDPGPGFPWDRLLAAVNAALDGGEDDDMSEKDSKILGALAAGLPQVDGQTFAPHQWQTQIHEHFAKLADWQKRVDEQLAQLAARPLGVLELTPESANALQPVIETGVRRVLGELDGATSPGT